MGGSSVAVGVSGVAVGVSGVAVGVSGVADGGTGVGVTFKDREIVHDEPRFRLTE